MKSPLAGVRRKTEFSPNHVVNDLLIINRTADALRRLGAEVTMYDEGSITPDSLPERVIISMAQGPVGSNILLAVEDAGALIINSPRGVMNCYRTRLVNILADAGIPFPRSVVLSSDSPERAGLHGFGSAPFWIKRGDVHAVHREDVVLVGGEEEEHNLRREFHARGIERVILQEHLAGDTVKFYAVKGTDLFHWYYLDGVYHTKFNQKRLRDLASGAADALGLYVYGGDAIIATDGSITIIDINDWPSFAPVRELAAGLIAQVVFAKAKEFLD